MGDFIEQGDLLLEPRHRFVGVLGQLHLHHGEYREPDAAWVKTAA